MRLMDSRWRCASTLILAAAMVLSLAALSLTAGCGGGKDSAKPPTSGGEDAWSGETKYSGGREATLAATRDAWVVHVHRGKSSDNLWCQTGRLKNGSIEWVGQAFDIGEGKLPSVAVRDDGLAVLVCVGADPHGLTKLECRVGRLDKANGAINWSKPVNYDNGYMPKVSISNGGWVLETHRGASRQMAAPAVTQIYEPPEIKEDKWYTLGLYNAETNSISFQAAASWEGEAFVSLKDSGIFMLLGNGWYQAYQTDTRSNTIYPWSARRPDNRLAGYNPLDFSPCAWKVAENTYNIAYTATPLPKANTVGFRYMTVALSPHDYQASGFSEPQVVDRGDETSLGSGGGYVVEMHNTGSSDYTLYYRIRQAPGPRTP